VQRFVLFTLAGVVLLVGGWTGVLFWFNELRYHFHKTPEALVAARNLEVTAYDCPEVPSYRRVEERLAEGRSDPVPASKVLGVWTKEMAAFELCNARYRFHATLNAGIIEAAYEEELAISQRDGLHEISDTHQAHFAKARREARQAEELKAMWLDGKWPEDFLAELQREDPAGYELLTGQSAQN
jgi:hypothetical protein